MPPPLARSNEEAHLYMRLHTCSCGATDFGSTSSVRQVDGVWVVRYAGPCVRCGRYRSFEFAQPAEVSIPDEDAWAAGGEPSQLLDAGEWLGIADVYGSAPAEPAGLTDAELAQLRGDLRAAAAALDEVLKFIPADAEQVPESGFWSFRGRQVRDVEPGRFRRVRLAAARDTYRRLAAAVQGVAS